MQAIPKKFRFYHVSDSIDKCIRKQSDISEKSYKSDKSYNEEESE